MRTFSKEKRRAIDEELDRLLVARFIELVKFPTRIANVVLVKKSNGKWRMQRLIRREAFSEDGLKKLYYLSYGNGSELRWLAPFMR
ncbi:hypothetical protein AgCh_018998 [Apium graveolens]